MDAQVLTSFASEFFMDWEGIIERAYDPFNVCIYT